MYEWIKAFHVVAVISWMAGMLYLPRLMVYHAEAQIGSIQSETFKIMERRLLKGIINPAMTIAWVIGLYLAWEGFGFKGGWLHGKILLALVLSAIHGMLVKHVRAFAADCNVKSPRYFRILNEVPAVLMVGIVILVIVKPF
ncbi:protoporphyrinogen oxidase HemJ [Bosea sp. (in: a-proteobacteria)]|uniref:protoporphyrinogen oxidase HemJ n=1 Tax=Bosea sp. (in: a-proteobacteria) TaxID=1871050 RepID=UPI00262E5305|nr:protoporphyrinogen oxidase HemJ [Bosea sp. (in: a-proteobacteria)]MCO5090506.1 protoporphyrinogen oxidase HemJ [Bosea sp. (in: a-proteobacteria)]